MATGLGIINNDGKASYGLKIDERNRAHTFATTTTQEKHATTIEEAFLLSTAQGPNLTLTVPDGFNGPIMAIRNDNQARRAFIQKILAGASAAGLTVYLARNPEFDSGSLANQVAIESLNLNFGSTKKAVATTYIWDEVGTAGIGGFTISDSQRFDSVPIGLGKFEVDIDGSIALPATTWLLVCVENPSGGAIEFAASTRFFNEGIAPA